jgi:hypothetical protein
VEALATVEKINPSYVSRLLRLMLLATDIVEAFVDRRQPKGMTPPGLMVPFPVEWGQQSAARNGLLSASQSTCPTNAGCSSGQNGQS